VTYLLDVSVLLAWLVANHPDNHRVLAWERGKSVAVCPITELGVLRIACNTYGSSLTDARKALAAWTSKRKPLFLPCSIPAGDGTIAPTWQKTTDFYLGDLATAHAMRLATLDSRMGHSAAECIV